MNFINFELYELYELTEDSTGNDFNRQEEKILA